jgi:integrase
VRPGLRCGEMIALEWGDVDLAKRQLCVRRSDWNGQVGTPRGGRQRYLPLTRRLTAALAEHRHLRSKRVFCQDDRTPFTRQIVQGRMLIAARRANVRRGVHILRHTFCSHLSIARGAAKGDPGASRACGSDHDPALHAPQSGSPRRGDRAAGSAVRRSKLWRYIGNGESVAKMINESGD